MRRLLRAPAVALMLVLGAATAAGAISELEVSGYVTDTKSTYSMTHPVGDDLFWSRAVVFYEGPLTIGGQTDTAGIKVVLARTLDANFEGTMEGTQMLDLRELGYGKCLGPLEVTMTANGGTYPSHSIGSAECTGGASLEVEYQGEYQPDGSYRHDIVSGSLTLPE